MGIFSALSGSPILTAAAWIIILAVELGFLWLFFWLLYESHGRSLSRARLMAAGLALLGTVLTPAGAYLAWFAPSGSGASAVSAAPATSFQGAPVAPVSSRPFSLGAASADRGKELVQQMNCLACHRIQGKGGTVAPDLWGVGNRRDADWIFRHFRDPQGVSPGTLMPRFPLSDGEFKELTAYLLTLRENP